MLYRCKEELLLENTWNGRYVGGGGTIKADDTFRLIGGPSPKKKLYTLMKVGRWSYVLQIRENDFKRFFEEVSE